MDRPCPQDGSGSYPKSPAIWKSGSKEQYKEVALTYVLKTSVKKKDLLLAHIDHKKWDDLA